MAAAHQLTSWNSVTAVVPLDLSLAEADHLLAEAPEAWLPEAAAAYEAERDTMVSSIGLPGLLAPVRRRVVVDLGPITRVRDCVRRQLAWRAASQARLFPTMEGSLTITRSSAFRSVLEVRAHYQPPLGSAGRLADRALLHLVAAASIRRFAAEVAQRMEEVGQDRGDVRS